VFVPTFVEEFIPVSISGNTTVLASFGDLVLGPAQTVAWINGQSIVANLTGNQIIPTANVTATGGNQSTAAALSYGINFVSGGNGSTGVILPAAVVGLPIPVFVIGGTGNLSVYPPIGGTIDGGGGNASIVMGNNTATEFVAQSATAYFSNPKTAS